MISSQWFSRPCFSFHIRLLLNNNYSELVSPALIRTIISRKQPEIPNSCAYNCVWLLRASLQQKMSLTESPYRSEDLYQPLSE